MSRGPKGEKRTQIDDLRTAYHVVNFVQQVGWFRREWDELKGTLLELLTFGTAAGLALLLGWWMSCPKDPRESAAPPT
jgi:hypothetical protein